MLATFRSKRLLKASKVISSIPRMHKSSKLKLLNAKARVSNLKLCSARDNWIRSLISSNQNFNCYGLNCSKASFRYFSTSENESKTTEKPENEDSKKDSTDKPSESEGAESGLKVSEETFVEFTKKDPGLQKRVKGIELPEAKVEEVDEDLELEKTERGRIVRERRVFVSEYKHFVYEQKWGSFMIVTGICLFVLGTWSLMVPLYKVVCEGFGFSTKSHKSDYNIDVTQTDVLRKWIVNFKAGVQDDLPWKFDAETKLLVVGAGETALAFYKAYNSSDKPIVGLSIYQVDPNDASLYFNKVQ